MEQKDSLERILREVEQDESLSVPPDPSATASDAEASDGGAAWDKGQSAPMLPPDLLSKLPQLLQVVQVLGREDKQEDEPRPQSPEKLLCALRPYLSQSRRQALDTMLRVFRLGQTLKSLK